MTLLIVCPHCGRAATVTRTATSEHSERVEVRCEVHGIIIQGVQLDEGQLDIGVIE